jgi:DNA invertase Pin-like site-specific DNA recombinase
VFADKGISAANGDDRPEYERFRRWLREGRIAQVWTVEQARLERREVQWFELAAEMDAAGISELHTNRDGVVRVRDDVAGIKAVLAAGEVRKLKRRVNDRLAEIAAEGRPHGGRTFGYEHALDEDGRKTLALVADQAAVLRDAADKILSGWSLSNTAAELNRRGVRGANGHPVTYSTLKRMLTNPTVAGHRVYRGRIVGRGVWEPILDENAWQAVRAKLAKPRTVRKVNGGTYDITDHQYGSRSARSRRRYLLTGGVAVCGVCRAPMKAQRRKVHGERLDAIYVCSSKYCVGIMADPLEAHVCDGLLDELDKPEFLAAVAADEHAARRDEITAALADLDRQRGELAAMWATPGQLTTNEWQAARRALAENEQRLRVDLAAVPPPLAGVDIADVRAAWPAMTLDERREIVGLFVDTVTVNRARPGTRAFDPGRVVIGWRIG